MNEISQRKQNIKKLNKITRQEKNKKAIETILIRHGKTEVSGHQKLKEKDEHSFIFPTL